MLSRAETLYSTRLTREGSSRDTGMTSAMRSRRPQRRAATPKHVQSTSTMASSTNSTARLGPVYHPPLPMHHPPSTWSYPSGPFTRSGAAGPSSSPSTSGSPLSTFAGFAQAFGYRSPISIPTWQQEPPPSFNHTCIDDVSGQGYHDSDAATYAGHAATAYEGRDLTAYEGRASAHPYTYEAASTTYGRPQARHAPTSRQPAATHYGSAVTVDNQEERLLEKRLGNLKPRAGQDLKGKGRESIPNEAYNPIKGEANHTPNLEGDDYKALLERIREATVLSIDTVLEARRAPSNVPPLIVPSSTAGRHLSFLASPPLSRPPSTHLDCVACCSPTDRTSSVVGPCGHAFCVGCLARLVCVALTDESVYPLSCCKQPLPMRCVQEMSSRGVGELPTRPMKQEQGVRAAEDVATRSVSAQPTVTVEDLLLPHLLWQFREKQREYGAKPEDRVYCATARCSAFLGSAVHAEGAIALESSAPSWTTRTTSASTLRTSTSTSTTNTSTPTTLLCPSCACITCVGCRQPAHPGRDCAEQADTQFDALVKEHKWRRCPACGAMVERTEGCPHMTCRCGKAFCYLCGKKYTPRHACRRW
ncbi:hypothetical protein BD626DRAFT_577338 [Schizophyllum amplum]|uniref:RBR-type E3 ubiquitin transferase n=1 Tax=Schizophyllum amplum TaxID=97359 RepID=A0A550BSM8_9AGAR|nr:hypothetical protein BD626DRAFT_577338 [Auriculariopsis ampla]